MDKKEFEKRQLESKPFHEKYDIILRELNKDCATASPVEGNRIDMTFLKAKGFINFSPYEDLDNKFGVTLTSTGLIFITEGGFEEQDRLAKEKNDEIELSNVLAKHSIQNSKNSLWISIITTIITLAALIYSITIPDKPPVVKVIEKPTVVKVIVIKETPKKPIPVKK